MSRHSSDLPLECTTVTATGAITCTSITPSAGIVPSSSGIVPASGQHLVLNSGTTSTDLGGKTVRINSITNTGTANDPIGFQSKIGQGASTAKNVIGAEISPRLNDAVALT